MNNQLVISTSPSNPSKKGKGKKKNKKNKVNTVKQKPQRSTLQPRAHLSQCARLYAAALSNPWACDSPPCVPDDKVTPSYKFSVRAKGNFTVGTIGTGFIVVCPKTFGNDFSGVNSTVFKSNSTFTGNTIQANAVVVGVDEAALSRFPYQISDIGGGISKLQARLVGYGLRCFYTGTELNKGGLIQVFRQPQNSTTHQMTSDNLYSLSNTKAIPCDRRKHSVCWQPITPNDFEYSVNANNTDRTVATADTGAPCMGVMVSGATTGNSFEYEIIAHYELLGSPILTTKSHSDSVGMSAILTSIPKVIETVSNIYQGDLLNGALKAIEMASGLYFGPPAPRERVPVLSNYSVEEL